MFGQKKRLERYIEQYRPVAQTLDRHVYENVLLTAQWPDVTWEGRALAARDPDAWVATVLAKWATSERMTVEQVVAFAKEFSDFCDDSRAIEADLPRG